LPSAAAGGRGQADLEVRGGLGMRVRVEELGGATLLGEGLDLEVIVGGERCERYTFHDDEDGQRPPLLWIDRGDDSGVVLVLGGRVLARVEVERAGGRGAENWETWSGQPADEVEQLLVPAISGAWRLLGDARQLAYRSDKWTREPVDYFHPIEDNVEVWMRGSLRAGLITVAGGGFRLTADGLEG